MAGVGWREIGDRGHWTKERCGRCSFPKIGMKQNKSIWNEKSQFALKKMDEEAGKVRLKWKKSIWNEKSPFEMKKTRSPSFQVDFPQKKSYFR